MLKNPKNAWYTDVDNGPVAEILKNFRLSYQLEMTNEISYKQWVKIDAVKLKTIITPVDVFVKNIITKLSSLCTYDFFTKGQTEYFRKIKDELTEGTDIFAADLSKTIFVSCYLKCSWKENQLTIHM